MRFRIPRPSPAMIVACLSLFVAMSGTAVAAGLAKNSVTSKQVKNSSLTGSDIKNDSLTGADIKESTVSKVPSASTADSATSAGSVSGRTITDGNVVAHSLAADKVSHQAGSFQANFASVAAGACQQNAVHVDLTNVDMRDDAISVTAENNWPSGLTIATENSDSVGYIRLDVCNPTGSAIDPPNMTFHYIAFSVPGL
ncbi:MAG: hypothetical protein QM648_04510 [Solirubrobacterales bacterium]